VTTALVAAVLATAVGVAACGGVQDEPAEAPAQQQGASEQAGAEEVGLGESLAQIRGHLLVSLELYEAGDADGALAHAGHPAEEILDSLRSELSEHGSQLGPDLSRGLEEGTDAVSSDAAATEVAQIYDDIAQMTGRAEADVVGEAVGSTAYRGSVVGALLATAGHEYEEATAGGGGVKLPVEYQDAYGFVAEARAMYEEDLATAVSGDAPEEAEEIAEAFDRLDRALESPEPPGRPTPSSEVETAATLIGHELEETVGARPPEEANPEQVVAEIEELLAEVLTLYEAGETDRAAEVAAEAYLENYEVIEAEVIASAPEVNEELEPLLGAELRRNIERGAPLAELEDMVARAERLLAEALEALEH
jgi:hypothetical protein